ncbi:hypothetical protein FSP39_013637 [Pinctada imbricata]|uniref:Uncharacterized protein n=1 Tax=Pinctada imbricata TaxID=66713 RepID=A0AA88XI60_PINIB|nr:hypothetical protein FSP39_013637 [Pinctada imbricata]
MTPIQAIDFGIKRSKVKFIGLSDEEMDENGKRRQEKIDDYFARVSPKRKRTESGNETEEEPVPSPSVASSISRCFSSDEDESEIGEDQSVRDEVQTEESEVKMYKRVTIYKICNKFLPKNTKDDISLQSDLLEMFQNEDALTLKDKDYQQECVEPFKCIWFTCEFGDDENENKTSQYIDQKLTGEKASIPKGNRRTSNLIILYRVTSDNTPEVFGVCESYPPQKILYMSDSKFRSDVANALMDGRRIVKLETMNIAGPEIRTRKVFASQSHVNCPGLNEVVTSATSFMRTDNSVFALLGGEKEKPTRMTIQLNCFRFELKMSLEKCAKVLEGLQGELNKHDGVTFYNFDNVYRDVDKTRIGDYEKDLKSAFIAYMCDEKEIPDSDFSLSHRYIEEWSDSLSVQLFRQIPLKGKRKDYKEVCSWRYPPSVGELKSELQTYYEELSEPFSQSDSKLWRSRMLEHLKEDLIFLSFGGLGKPRELLTFVHGSVDSRELSCKVYKLAQKWYVLTSAFSKLVDRNFVEFAKGAILSKDKGKLPLPWYSSSKKKEQQRGFTAVEIAESFDFKEANAEKLLDILSEPFEFLSFDKGNNLTEKSCNFLESSRIYKFLRQAVSKDNTSGKTDAINPEEKTDCNEKSATSKTKKSKKKMENQLAKVKLPL